tara:strand:+ start:1115 stop:1330 length:216 start_codon:yes stop_codon:yes gene_type:complete
MTIVILMILVTLIISVYLWPLIIYRLRTKKVNLKVNSMDGESISMDLLLEKDDPLWELIEAHRETIHASKK